MPRTALKKLTRSDLTLFETLFRRIGAGNQKAINLNADVFVDGLYPALAEPSSAGMTRLPVDVDILGPGGAPRINLQRKIVKGTSYKNWRLNGEFIHDPEGQAGRFDSLAEDDFAILEFSGEPLPSAVLLVLVSRALSSELHKECSALIDGRSMVALDSAQIDRLVAVVGSPLDLPLAGGGQMEGALEDAALGGENGAATLRRRSETRPVSAEELLEARRRADETGQVGEELVAAHLDEEKAAGRIAGFDWESRSNAVAPFDFRITAVDGSETLVDVKSTRTAFDNPLHVSTGELSCMVASPNYRIYRVSGITASTAQLAVSEPMAAVAAGIQKAFSGLPAGVKVDSVAIDPRTLTWKESRVIDSLRLRTY